MDLIRPALEARFGRGHPAVEGLHPVGRLDTQTEGLLILTNDGAFTNRLTHPRHQVPKIYIAEVRGVPDEAALERLRTGVPLFGRYTLPARVRISRIDRSRNNCVVEIELKEGRQQQVRRMLQAVGYPVDRLRRVAIGPIEIERMKPAQWRFLTEAEIETLWRASEPPQARPPEARPPEARPSSARPPGVPSPESRPPESGSRARRPDPPARAGEARNLGPTRGGGPPDRPDTRRYGAPGGDPNRSERPRADGSPARPRPPGRPRPPYDDRGQRPGPDRTGPQGREDRPRGPHGPSAPGRPGPPYEDRGRGQGPPRPGPDRRDDRPRAPRGPAAQGRPGPPYEDRGRGPGPARPGPHSRDDRPRGPRGPAPQGRPGPPRTPKPAPYPDAGSPRGYAGPKPAGKDRPTKPEQAPAPPPRGTRSGGKPAGPDPRTRGPRER